MKSCSIRRLPRRARDVLHGQLGQLDLLLHPVRTASRDVEPEQRPTIFRERVLGLVGHNFLSLDEARDVQSAIPRLVRELQAPDRLGPDGDEFWTLITPLAPGADLILARALTRELSALSTKALRRYRLIIVRCVGRSPGGWVSGAASSGWVHPGRGARHRAGRQAARRADQ